MPRIKLSNWYGNHKPGDELDVDEVLLKALRRDGLVAEVLGYDNGGALKPGASLSANETSQPETVEPAVPPEPGRKRR